MGDSSGVAEQVLPLPKGGGAIKGIGESFRPDVQTGTGNFSIPIAVPDGRNGVQPRLALTYSTGNPNGPCGLGWSFQLPSVSRKTSKGVPRYHGDDAYLLSGDELVLVDGAKGLYRPRSEGLFAQIAHIGGAGERWEIVTRSGLTTTYGDSPASRIHDEADSRRIFQWLPAETRDANGNRVVYRYKREDRHGLEGEWYEDGRSYNQLYLAGIDYGNYPASGGERLLFSIEFDYGEFDPDGAPTGTWDYRPDPFSSYRAGFEVRTVRRCRRVLVKVHETSAPATGTLVRSYRLRYLDELPEADRRGEPLPLNGVSLLADITLTGQRTDHGAQTTESLPPLAFRYTRFDPEQRRFKPLSARERELPARSLAADDLALVDLFGSGLPSVLESTPETYRFWRNLGDGRLDGPHPMRAVPAGVSLADRGVQLADVEGTGSAALLVTRPPLAGYYPTTFDGTWSERSFQAYEQAPSFDLEDPAVRLVDVDGDGRIDALQTNTTDLVLFRNLGRRGWADPEHVPRSRLGRLAGLSFATSGEPVRLAAMNGDLQDLVMVRDRAVEYAPSLGHGSFGPVVTMRNAPRLPSDYDPRRLFISDIDGDGYADLVYVDFDRVRFWINQSGNAWSEEHVIRGTPEASDLDAVRVADMNGTGTSGVLWTSDRAFSGAGYHYLDFVGGVKPHLLCELDNQLGAVTSVSYAPSTKFYLDDLARGEPWKTQLPFPVHVVERVVVLDLVSRSRLLTRYAYHHGCWDGKERRFCGFGCVDEFDSETFESYAADGSSPFEPVPERHFSPPTRVRTWFHVGHDVDYWGEPGRVRLLPAGLDDAERREALWSLRGAVLRRELSALDGNAREDQPYTVDENRYRIERVAAAAQPSADPDAPRAVFFAHPHESIARRIDRGVEPRTNRTVTLYDAFGNVTREVTAGRPRGGGDPLVLVVDTSYAPPPAGGLRVTDRVAERRVTRPSTADRALVGSYLDAVPEPGFDAEPDWGALAATGGELLSHTRFFYDGPAYQGLPLGQVERGNLARVEKLALTPAIIAAAYPSAPGGAEPRPPDALADLAAQHYVHDAAGWWVQVTRRMYDLQRPGGMGYGLVVGLLDPNDNETRVGFDTPYWLFPVHILEPLGLTTSVTIDYQALKPRLHVDPNQNETEYAHGPLGDVVAIAAKGKGEGDTLAAPTVRFEYDLHRFQTTGEPVAVRKLQRREHAAAATLESWEHFDGFGRSVQSKAEAGPATPGGPKRWLTSGWRVYDNKGRIVERYEPFFSATASYEPEAAHGARTTIEYDPLGRPLRTINPDGSSRRVVYGTLADPAAPDAVEPNAWEAWFYDENDTAATVYYQDGTAGPRAATEIAGLRIGDHLDTPRREVYDTWGRRSASHEDNGVSAGARQVLVTAYEQDALSRVTAITDPAGRVALRYVFDLLGRCLRYASIDAGARTELFDAAGNLVERTDARGAKAIGAYDALDRPTEVRARDGAGEPLGLRERHTYDRRPGVTLAQARLNNSLGRLVRSYDGAGRVDYERYDFKGNVLRKTRRVVGDSVAQPVWPVSSDSARNGLLAPGPGHLLELEYDAVNHPVAVTCPDGKTIHRSFSELGVLDGIAVDAQPHVGIEYNARGQRTHVSFANGVATDYSYDPGSFRLAKLLSADSGGRHLQDLEYTHDPAGNVVRIDDLAPTRLLDGHPYISNSGAYRYDPLYRLVFATGRERKGIDNFAPPDALPLPLAALTDFQAYERHYGYDANGNLASEQSVLAANQWARTFVYAPGTNRIDHAQRLGGASVAYGYDAAGNLAGVGADWRYLWDYAGCLKAVEHGPPGSPPVMRADHLYDARGMRIKTVVRSGSVTRTTVYVDGIFEERTERAGAVVTARSRIKHLLGPTSRFALVKDLLAGAAADPESPVAYQHEDHLGGAHLVTGTGGALLDQEEFYPYGETSLGGYAGKRYRFSGKERGEESGLYYYGARHYVPRAGRFASVDPAGPIDSLNLYRFARNNPVRLTDADGLQSKEAPAASGASAPPVTVTFTDAESEQAGGHIRGVTKEVQQHIDAWTKTEEELKGLKGVIEKGARAEPIPPPGAADYDDTSPGHEAKVIMTIDYALLQATHTYTNKYTGKVEATHLQQLLQARKIVTELRQSKDIPDASQSIILRDAEYYLLARGYIQEIVIKQKISQHDPVPIPDAVMRHGYDPVINRVGPPAAHTTYESIKKLRILLGSQKGMQATSDPMARPGGEAWVTYGQGDYLEKDVDQLTASSPPSLVMAPPPRLAR